MDIENPRIVCHNSGGIMYVIVQRENVAKMTVLG